jgi:Asp-tRNA(Asn)/Glu-tRNA(Gln) amidotransferase A subunit family amidase
MDLCQLSARQLRDALVARELSAVEALDAILERADRLAGPINPFSLRLDERARSAATAADAALARGTGGPLCGVPVTIKDSHYLAGVPAASGSRTLLDFVPSETSAAVERIEAAGAVIFAKTTTPEFCYFGITESPVNGVTSNPWNLERTPGGSSGGAGAAVAAGLGPLALGGDGGGSIRIPAAFCGVVGYKPTFGLVPREPCSAGWKTLVSYGPIARTVADARLALQALAGMHVRDRHSVSVEGLAGAAAEPSGLRVVVSDDLGFAPVDDDVRAAFRAAIRDLEAAGAHVLDGTPGLGSSVAIWSAIATADARCSEASAYEDHRELLGEAALEFLTFGSEVTLTHYVTAQMARETIHRAYVDLFDRTGATVLLTPTLGCEAFAHGATHPDAIGGVPIEPPWRDWGGFLYDANLGGFPACAVPIGLGDDGLPVSLQVLGLRGHDGVVLAVAETVERLVGFSAHPPLGEDAPVPYESN